MKYDYLIVGQGLAGSILAYQLIERGKSVVILDDQKFPSSSKVAAGLVNPFTGPKMVKSWRAEILFPFLQQFYSKIQDETKAKFFYNRTIYRPFQSVEDSNDWYGRSSQENYQQFIEKICNPGAHGHLVYDPHGGIEVRSFELKVRHFLEIMNEFFRQKGAFIESFFDEEQLEIFDGGVKYQNIEASRIIFCTGHQVSKSKYFGWIPIAPVKGEILYVKMDQDFKTIYNKSCFIIPQGDGIFKVGSTYDRHDLTENITDSGKDEICKKLDALCKMKYEVIGQEAGIRPGTMARRPLMGVHPAHNFMFVFNGLGTKGVSLAPFFSHHFVKCLEEGNYLDKEVDIKKYNSLYFNSQFDTES